MTKKHINVELFRGELTGKIDSPSLALIPSLSFKMPLMEAVEPYDRYGTLHILVESRCKMQSNNRFPLAEDFCSHNGLILVLLCIVLWRDLWLIQSTCGFIQIKAQWGRFSPHKQMKTAAATMSFQGLWRCENGLRKIWSFWSLSSVVQKK